VRVVEGSVLSRLWGGFASFEGVAVLAGSCSRIFMGNETTIHFLAEEISS
jgi:hypothetical protein